jgi:hypothetical protein
MKSLSMPSPLPQNYPRKLPLPRWIYILLAAPTFFSPLVYTVLCVWVFSKMLVGGSIELPEWFRQVGYFSLYVTFALLPIYALWTVLTRRLTWREKILWLFLIVWANMIGMAFFYVWMIRRYLGLEGRLNARDTRTAEKLLASCGLTREKLTESQWQVIARYARQTRQSKWMIVPVIVLVPLMLYVSCIIIPRMSLKIAKFFTPTHTIIIDTVKNTRQEVFSDPQMQTDAATIFLAQGAMAGMLGMWGIFCLFQGINLFIGNQDRRAFLQYLKASSDRIVETETLGNDENPPP